MTKKHKHFSNLIIKRFIVGSPEIDKLKDILQHTKIFLKKKFDDFTVCAIWKENDVLINKISVPSTITLEKPHLFKPSLIELPIVVRVSPLGFLDTSDRNIDNEFDEIKILFITDLKNITFFLYMAQPNSKLCRKLFRRFIEEDFGNFDYNWLRHINN